MFQVPISVLVFVCSVQCGVASPSSEGQLPTNPRNRYSAESPRNWQPASGPKSNLSYGSFLRTNLIFYTVDEYPDELPGINYTESRVTAKTVAELWRTLAVARRVNEIVWNVTERIAKDLSAAENNFDEIMAVMFAELNVEFENDLRVSPPYRHLKSKIAYSARSLRRTKAKWQYDKLATYGRLLQHTSVKRCVLNERFLFLSRHDETVKTENGVGLWPELILSLSEKNLFSDELQQIYDSTLRKASQSINETTGFGKGLAELVHHLKTEIAKNCPLNAFINMTKNYNSGDNSKAVALTVYYKNDANTIWYNADLIQKILRVRQHFSKYLEVKFVVGGSSPDYEQGDVSCDAGCFQNRLDTCVLVNEKMNFEKYLNCSYVAGNYCMKCAEDQGKSYPDIAPCVWGKDVEKVLVDNSEARQKAGISIRDLPSYAINNVYDKCVVGRQEVEKDIVEYICNLMRAANLQSDQCL